MIISDIICFVVAFFSFAVMVFALYFFGLIIRAMYVSENNCHGCPNYPKRCKNCRVYKNMDDDIKKNWL